MANSQFKSKTIYYKKKPFAEVINQARPGPHYYFDRENTLSSMYVYNSSKRGELIRIFCPTMKFYNSVIFLRSTLKGLEIGPPKKEKHNRDKRHRRKHKKKELNRHTN